MAEGQAVSFGSHRVNSEERVRKSKQAAPRESCLQHIRKKVRRSGRGDRKMYESFSPGFSSKVNPDCPTLKNMPKNSLDLSAVTVIPQHWRQLWELIYLLKEYLYISLAVHSVSLHFLFLLSASHEMTITT